MICPHCGENTTANEGRCSSCHRAIAAANLEDSVTGAVSLPTSSDSTLTEPFVPSRATRHTAAGVATPPPSGVANGTGALTLFGEGDTRGPRSGSAGGHLAPGYSLGARYHIIRLLGAGGMGAVYQAWDQELEVAVAVKVIRPEILEDPQQAEDIERRFKRELLLARQVTHKNVVRIHDFGEIDGIKYITMPYVQGSDLATVLKRQGKLPVQRVLAIARQVAGGLVAAHEAGIVHRDLKPENIMIEGDNALVMDFGIARSITAAERTVGVVRGTIGYLAPEQAQGGALDQRVDVYAFGLILYDSLLGRVRHTKSGKTDVGELMERMQRPPRSAREIDPEIPIDVDRIVARCVEPDPANRYHTMTELLRDLDRLDEDGHVVAGTTTIPFAPPPRRVVAVRRWGRLPTAKTVGIAGAVAVLIVIAATAVTIIRRPAAPQSPAVAATQEATALAILPFRNASGDATLDWLGPSLSEILRTEVGQSATIRTIGSDRLQQLLTDLRIPVGTSLDPATLRKLAEFSNAQAVMWGQFLKFGSEIRIDATIEDLNGQRSIPLKAQAQNQNALVAALGTLANEVRASLASGAGGVIDASAPAKPSSQSLQALRYYNEGLTLSRQGKHSDALKSFEAATKEDSEFALAYAKLGEAYKNLGYDSEAEQWSRRASTLSDALPPKEKYLILAGYARIVGDNAKAIEAYNNLLKTSPNDLEVHFQLARLLESTGSLDQARDHYNRVLKDDPKFVDALLGIGRVEINRAEPDAALEHLNQALTLAIQLENNEARGNILQAMGVAYKVLNKPEEALRYYKDALEIRRGLGQKGGEAASLSEIAKVNMTMGRREDALKNYTEALQLRRQIGDKQGTANSLQDLGTLHFNRGDYDQALGLFRESLNLQRELGNRNYEALLLNNIGSVYFNQAKYEDALTYFERALVLREALKVPTNIAQTLHNLAEVDVKMGQYDKALEHYLRALELSRSAGDKRSAAIQSYSVGTIFEYQGRYGAALSSKEEALKTFEELGDNSFWRVEMLAGRGNALNQLGRFDDGRQVLEQALTRARELKNQAIVAETLNLLGDSYFYSGDLASARRQYDQALQTATTAGDSNLRLQTQIDLARLDAREKPAAAVTALTKLAQQADSEGLRYLATAASIDLGEALSRLKRYDAARQELQRAAATSERLGLRALQAGAHRALGEMSAAEGKGAEAARHQAEAARIFGEIQKEAGTDSIAKRVDLAQILSTNPR